MTPHSNVRVYADPQQGWTVTCSSGPLNSRHHFISKEAAEAFAVAFAGSHRPATLIVVGTELPDSKRLFAEDGT